MFSTQFATFAALACLSLAVIPVRSAVIQVTVGGTGVIAYTPNQVTANIGDVIEFTFAQKNHTVTQSTLASPCTPLEGGFDSGFVPVAADATDFPLAQLTVKDLNSTWVFCRQAGHCAQGMVFAVNPGANFAAFQAAATGNASTTTSSALPSATAPTASSAAPGSPSSTSVATSTDHSIIVGGPNGNFYTPSNITAQPGDTVTFHFHEKNHTVTQSSFQNPCTPLSLTSTTGQPGLNSGFMPVAANATLNPTFTIQINDTLPQWFFCSQSGHCGSGMVFSVNAVETGPNNFAAFKAKAIQLNGTAASAPAPASASGSGTTDTTSAASALPVRSAAAMMALVGLVVGIVL
ncbi:Cupredoxin [Mycena rosella]|uniref:Cupredoxin n=1 Tax=Mycena rosella TaxID=1033263 RepID=A0AAD7DXS0_MYCRO|nr:Cupredoxin [Mycena rosella]